MKIVDRATFLEMPCGTLFSKYHPCCFGDLCIKEQSLGTRDFVYQPITDAIECSSSDDLFDKLQLSELTGQDLPTDFDSASRDGFYEDDQLFAVWSRKDVQALMSRLEQALADSSPQS